MITVRYIQWPLCGTYSDRCAVDTVTAVRYIYWPLCGTYSDHCAAHILTTVPLCGTYSDSCAVHIVTTVRYIWWPQALKLLIPQSYGLVATSNTETILTFSSTHFEHKLATFHNSWHFVLLTLGFGLHFICWQMLHNTTGAHRKEWETQTDRQTERQTQTQTQSQTHMNGFTKLNLGLYNYSHHML